VGWQAHLPWPVQGHPDGWQGQPPRRGPGPAADRAARQRTRRWSRFRLADKPACPANVHAEPDGRYWNWPSPAPAQEGKMSLSAAECRALDEEGYLLLAEFV